MESQANQDNRTMKQVGLVVAALVGITLALIIVVSIVT